MQSKNLAISIWQSCNQVREIAEATRQIGNMELTEMVAALMGAKDAVPYNAFSECHFHLQRFPSDRARYCVAFFFRPSVL